MKTIRLYIGKQDIEQGVRSDCGNCPIARALTRKFPPTWPKEVWKVGTTHASLRALQSNKQVRRFIFSEGAENFVREFDLSPHGAIVKPRTVRLYETKPAN